MVYLVEFVSKMEETFVRIEKKKLLVVGFPL